MLDEIATLAGKKAKIALRVNPDVDAHTHYKMTTGKKENKFGVDWKKPALCTVCFPNQKGCVRSA